MYKQGDKSDYPVIGVDPRGFHLQNPVLDPSNNLRYTRINIVPADVMANAVPCPPADDSRPSLYPRIFGWTFYDLQGPDGKAVKAQLTPLVHHGVTKRAYYASFHGRDALLVWVVTGAGKPHPQLKRWSLAIRRLNDTVNAKQLGSAALVTLGNVANIILQGVYRAPHLLLGALDGQTFGTATPLAAVRLIRVPVSSNSGNPLAADLDISFGLRTASDAANARSHYYFPAVEVNSKGDAAIVFGRSGDALAPEIRYSAWYHREGHPRPSMLVKATGHAYTNGLQPDIVGAALDPSDDAIWFAFPYPNAKGGYDISVSRVFGRARPD